MKDAVQEQLVALRRNQILEAATKVFAEKGFHPTTIKDIAREAGVADGTIYNYFANKPALLIGILDRMKDAVLQDVTFIEFSEVDFRTFMKAYLKHPLMALKADNFELFRVVMSEIMVNKELRELYYQKIFEPTLTEAEVYFQYWSERNTIRPINIGLTLRAISGLIFGLILQNIMGDKSLEAQWDEMPDFLTDLILNGLILNDTGSNLS